jgi:hypothetical protein
MSVFIRRIRVQAVLHNEAVLESFFFTPGMRAEEWIATIG